MNAIDVETQDLEQTPLNLSQLEDKMVKDGYVIFKDIISESLLADIKKNFHDTLVSLGAKNNDPFHRQYLDVIKTIPPFTVNIELRRHLLFSRLPHKILHTPLIFNALNRLLGADLSFLLDAELVVNLKGRKEYYLVKKFHQEFWSGAGYRTYVIWAPFIFPQGSGGLEIVKGSHVWGHVPHRNRAPIHIPENASYDVVDTEHYSERDVVLFHSLTLHRTIPNKVNMPRLAYATHIRNTFDQDSGFEVIKNWEIFNMSATSRIMRDCGNPHLSPFRTLEQ